MLQAAMTNVTAPKAVIQNHQNAGQSLEWLTRLFILFLFPALLMWLHSDSRLTGDIAWYLIAAQKLVGGGSITATFYDTNPPMSTMIYVPTVFLFHMGLPLWATFLVYIYLLIFLCIGLTYKLLQSWPGLRPADIYVAVTAYILMIFLSAHCVGMKDHLIGMTLVPFCLAQMAITHRHSGTAWFTRGAVLLGVPFILVKPHYGLLAVALLIWRFIKQKRYSLIFDFDFVALAIGTLLYAAIIVLWFPDFINEVLPISFGTYVHLSYGNSWPVTVAFSIFFLCLAAMTSFLDTSAAARSLAILFWLMAILALVPFLVQMKGFFLHLLPVLFMAGIALFLSLSLWVETLIKNTGKNPAFSTVIILAVMTAGGLFYNIADKSPSRYDYLQSDTYNFIVKNAANSSFFIESIATDENFIPSVYSSIPVASRFSSMWPVSGMLEMEENDPQRQKLHDYFGQMIADDLANYKPAFIALYAPENQKTGYDFQSTSIASFFGDYPAFAKELSHYRKNGTLASDYFFPEPAASGVTNMRKGVVLYDIYYRKD
jgi:hypothetical protein